MERAEGAVRGGESQQQVGAQGDNLQAALDPRLILIYKSCNHEGLRRQLRRQNQVNPAVAHLRLGPL